MTSSSPQGKNGEREILKEFFIKSIEIIDRARKEVRERYPKLFTQSESKAMTLEQEKNRELVEKAEHELDMLFCDKCRADEPHLNVECEVYRLGGLWAKKGLLGRSMDDARTEFAKEVIAKLEDVKREEDWHKIENGDYAPEPKLREVAENKIFNEGLNKAISLVSVAAGLTEVAENEEK